MSSDLTASAGGSGGVTNAAGANVIPKSDGTNLVASGFTDNGTTISTPEKIATAATTGLVGIGMAPVAMLDITAPSTLTGIKALGTPPVATSGAATNAVEFVTIAGTAGGATTSTGGDQGGSGATITMQAGPGGKVSGNGGAGAGGNGGNSTYRAGAGGLSQDPSNGNGGQGGAFVAVGGAGGSSENATGGLGGAATLTGGAGGAPNGGGGAVTIRGGAKNGAGTSGTVTIGDSNTPAVNIGSTSTNTTITGGQKISVVAKTANYTLTLFDFVVTVDATGGNVTLILPAAAIGQTYRIKRLDASGNTVTITAAGADTIDGAATVTLATQYAAKDIIGLTASTWGVF